jgi:hypothetical protein
LNHENDWPTPRFGMGESPALAHGPAWLLQALATLFAQPTLSFASSLVFFSSHFLGGAFACHCRPGSGQLSDEGAPRRRCMPSPSVPLSTLASFVANHSSFVIGRLFPFPFFPFLSRTECDSERLARRGKPSLPIPPYAAPASPPGCSTVTLRPLALVLRCLCCGTASGSLLLLSGSDLVCPWS